MYRKYKILVYNICVKKQCIKYMALCATYIKVDNMKIIMIKNTYLTLGKSVAVPDDEEFKVGDAVVFSDDVGLHLAEVERVGGKFDPQYSVVFERRATAADLEKAASNENKLRRARRYISSLLLKHNLELKVVDVYATLDFSKAIFYFTADGRVDFRDLVRDLAGELRTRIEMRQVNEREEITMCGGIGPCGQPCCCRRFLGKAGQVSIKMAKTQGISLNPNKINGYCGKLMCCLAYENETYLDALRTMPKVGSSVKLPTGETGVVNFNNLFKKIVMVEVFGENAKKVDYSLEELQACNEKFETDFCGCDCQSEDKGNGANFVANGAPTMNDRKCGGCACCAKNNGANIELANNNCGKNNFCENKNIANDIDCASDKKDFNQNVENANYFDSAKNARNCENNNNQNVNIINKKNKDIKIANKCENNKNYNTTNAIVSKNNNKSINNRENIDKNNNKNTKTIKKDNKNSEKCDKMHKNDSMSPKNSSKPLKNDNIIAKNNNKKNNKNNKFSNKNNQNNIKNNKINRNNGNFKPQNKINGGGNNE